MQRATTALLSRATVVALLVACGTDHGDDPTNASASSEMTSSQHPTSDAASPDAASADASQDNRRDGDPAFAEGSGKQDLVLTTVRVAEHHSFDRIVLEFTGTGIPGWSVDYTDKARLDGSGEAVALSGDAILNIFASGTPWPVDDYYSGPTQFSPDNGGAVSDVLVGGTFEGYTQVLAGIDGDPVPFRVFALSHPSRLVVDVIDERAQ